MKKAAHLAMHRRNVAGGQLPPHGLGQWAGLPRNSGSGARFTGTLRSFGWP